MHHEVQKFVSHFQNGDLDWDLTQSTNLSRAITCSPLS